MTAPGPGASARRSGAAAEISAFIACAVLPVAMVLANRSSVVVVALAALVALAGLITQERATDLSCAAISVLRHPVGLSITAFVAYFGLSLGWTTFPAPATAAYGEFAAGVAATVLLGLAWSVDPPARAGRFLAIGVIAAALLAIIDLRTGMGIRHLLGIRPNSFVLNRSLVTLVILVWPMLLLVGPQDRILAALAVLATVAAILHSESGAALVGMLVACLAAVFARIAPRVLAVVMAAGALLALLASPWIGPLADTILPANLHAALDGMHSQDRIDIWRSFGAAVEQRFWFGSGFNASARMADDPVAALVPEAQRVLLGAGHPHNALLQVWVEGGVMAALLLAVAICAVAAHLLAMPVRCVRFALPFAAGALFIAAVSHGAWQGWWIAIVGLAVALIAQDGRRDAHG